MADTIADKGMEGIKEVSDKMMKAVADGAKDAMKGEKAMFDLIAESCEEKSLLEQIYFKMKSGEWKASAKKKLDEAKDFFKDKAADFGDALKAAGDKGKALFDKIFKDGEKVDVDALKEVAATI